MGPRNVLLSLLMLFLIVGVGNASANPAQASGSDNVITGFEVFQEQDQTRLVLRGKKTPTFTVFKLKNPDRLVVDLIRTDLEGIDTPQEVDNLHIGRIATTQFKQAGSVVSRFLVGLKPDVRFSAKAEGSSVVVTIGGKNSKLFLRQAVIEKPEAAPYQWARQTAPVAEVVPAEKPQTPPPTPPKADHKVVESQGAIVPVVHGVQVGVLGQLVPVGRVGQEQFGNHRQVIRIPGPPQVLTIEQPHRGQRDAEPALGVGVAQVPPGLSHRHDEAESPVPALRRHLHPGGRGRLQGHYHPTGDRTVVATGVELEVVPATQLLLTLRQEAHGPLDGSAQFLVVGHGQALGQGQRTDGV